MGELTLQGCFESSLDRFGGLSDGFGAGDLLRGRFGRIGNESRAEIHRLASLSLAHWLALAHWFALSLTHRLPLGLSHGFALGGLAHRFAGGGSSLWRFPWFTRLGLTHWLACGFAHGDLAFTGHWFR